MKHLMLAAVVAAVATASVPAAAQVTFRQLGGFTDVRGGIGVEQSGPANNSVVNSYPAGPVTATSTFGNTSGTASFSASATAGGSLASTSQGTLSFSAVTSVANRAGDPEVVARAISNATYVFDVASLSRLSLDYLVSVSGDRGAGYLLLTERDANGTPIRTLTSQSNIGQSGSSGFDLTAGTYQLRFGNNVVNTVSFANPGIDADSISGRLSFAINAVAVPEPESWAMMLTGFGMAGAALRTRRRTARFA